MNYEINLVGMLDGFTNLNPDGELILVCRICGLNICACGDLDLPISLYAVPPVPPVKY